MSLAVAIGSPLEAEAKKAEPPPPPPTAYDELQKIISGRSGNTGSLLENFKKTVTAPVSGIVDKVQPSLPSAPQLTAPKASEPKSSLPGPKGSVQVPPQANAAVQEVQKGADQAVEAAPEVGSSQPLFLGLVAAVIGFGGYKVFTGRQGQVASKPGKAARGAKRQVQRQAGTKRIGAAAKQAPKKAVRPLQNAFQSSKAKAKQPAKKGGGLFNFGNAPSPKQAAKKIAPKATKKIQKGTKQIGLPRPGTKKIGTQRPGTKRTGGTKRIGASQPSRRLQLDEDTSSTLGAAGVVGLGLAVAAFIGFNLVATEETATAQEAVKEVIGKVADLPAAITDSGPKGPQDVVASAQNAAPDIKAPDVKAPIENAQKKLEEVPNAVATIADKAPEPSLPDSAAEAAKKAPEPVKEVAEKAIEAPQPDKPAEVPAPDPLKPKTDAAAPSPSPQTPVKAAAQEAPQAVAQLAEGSPNSPDAQAIAPRNFPPQETLQKPKVADRSPDTTTLRKGAVEAASREKANQTALQTEEQKPKPSAAFEAATKKLGSGKSSAELFAETRKQEEKLFEEESKKDALKAIGKAAPSKPGASKGSSLPAPVSKAASKAAEGGGSNSGLILGGLAAAVVVGLAVASPKDQAAGAAKEAVSSVQETAKSADAGSNSSKGSDTTDVKDDIASRKKEAQQWISEWREATGGK